ncbi:MAG: hypothetical protein HYY83_00240 [Deltaproteobacteria bacterium]|nr:hypothetical protein [Deltaproteobacteria bacterium]MBI3060402.1 hypothetical protein [Deltaproteobacteria bacterium]
MKAGKNLRKQIFVLAVAATLLSAPGCALFWLGAGGTGGYLIRKGEEGGGGGKRTSSEGNGESSKRAERY